MAEAMYFGYGIQEKEWQGKEGSPRQALGSSQPRELTEIFPKRKLYGTEVSAKL